MSEIGNSKWIKNLNLRPGLTKPLEEKIDSELLDTGLRVDFLGLTPKVKATDLKVGLIKEFMPGKETINKMKGKPTEFRENIFKSYFTNG